MDINKKNADRGQELNKLILELESQRDSAKEYLLEIESKLDIEMEKLKKTTDYSNKMLFQRDSVISDFSISTLLLICIFVINNIFSLGIILYLFIALYVCKMPKFIKVAKIIIKKEIESTEQRREAIRKNIDNLSANKKIAEEKLKSIYYLYDRNCAEKSVLEDINTYFEQRKSAELKRARCKYQKNDKTKNFVWKDKKTMNLSTKSRQ